MAMEAQETGVPWYAKFFEHWKNRNRVGPGRVELPDCDFFIVGPRRTLRVLRPALKSALYYETANDRPESINDNFFTRWSRRPHSSGNCRCSFRQSSRLSTTEEQIITAELNRIRTSLCEAEKTGQDIEQLERKLSVDLQKFQIPDGESKVDGKERNDEVVVADPPKTAESTGLDEQTEEQMIKNKIVKDLERYINTLLEEILDDTVKFIAETEGTFVEDVKRFKKKNLVESQRRSMRDKSSAKARTPSAGKAKSERLSGEALNDISFTFHGNDRESTKEIDGERKNEEVATCMGYVNRAFIGSTNDPDSLDFYLGSSVGTNVPLEQLDCTDSGINSVETIEFQPDQEPSLEQSLLQIIDEKLGRMPSKTGCEDLTGERKIDDISNGVQNHSKSKRTSPREEETLLQSGDLTDSREDAKVAAVNARNNVERNERVTDHRIEDKTIDVSTNDLNDELSTFPKLDDAIDDSTFDNLRLEIKNDTQEPAPEESAASKPTKKSKLMKCLRGKFKPNLDESSKGSKKTRDSKVPSSLELAKQETSPIELEDYKKPWPDRDDATDRTNDEANPRDFVIFRKNKKPTIVFLHGFGSSAEIFEHQLEYFSALGYPCIAPDMLGHGMSSAPRRSRDYHFTKLLKDLDAVLNHYAFNPGQKCVLVAHNYGCSFATALACKYDSSIHQLVLISGGGPTPLAPPSTESAGHWCLRAILAPFLMCGLHKGILYSARGRQHPYCGPEPVEQWPSHMKYILDGMVWPEGDYVFHRRICTPTLLVHGLRDNRVSLVQECQMERTMMKAFLEAIPAAGHSPMTDCPEQLNHMIHCFIDLWKNKKW